MLGSDTLTFQCNNPKCKRTFDLPARIEDMTKEEDTTPTFTQFKKVKTIYRTLVKHCCPFCESIDFKEVKV